LNNQCFAAFELELEKAMGLRDASPQFVQSLRRKVLEPQKSSYWRCPLVWRVALVLGLVMSFTFFAIGPQNVVAAVRQWLGQYFPGIGFVEDSTALRILESTASVQRDGAEVIVRWAYTTEEKTVIAYPEESDTRVCQNWLIYSPETRQQIQELALGKLFLTDGHQLEWDQNGGYQPVPPDVDLTTLVIYTHKATPDCPEGASCRCIDEDQRFEIPLKFIIPPPGTSLEIYELQFTPVAPTLKLDKDNE
jgi:hypothetical protein